MRKFSANDLLTTLIYVGCMALVGIGFIMGWILAKIW